MDDQDLTNIVTAATRIRLFFRELLGSRLAARAEEELLRYRGESQERLLEKDRRISEQADEIAQLKSKLAQWELVLIPLSSPAGNLLLPKKAPPTFDPVIEPSSWEATKALFYADQDRLAAEEEQQRHELPVTKREQEIQ